MTRKDVSDVVIKAASKDLAAYNNQQKSYELMTWLRDECILQQIRNRKVEFVVNAKACSRLIQALSWLRERGEVVSVQMIVEDTKSIVVKAKVEIDELPNYQRRRINLEYGEQLPMREEEEAADDFTAMH